MENFKEGLLDFVKAKLSLDLERVRKFDIKGKEFLVYDDKGKRYGIALDEIKRYESEGCSVCADYTAELADISVGSVGSEEGWSTVFARTKTGEEIVEGALEKGYIEAKEIEPKGLGLIRRLGERKRERGSTK
jgi:coenzyme F420 hydrogenase subunit beta